jgi:hypothetical protein
MRGIHSDFRCSVFTILDMFSLLVSQLDVKSELAGLTLTQEAF